MLLRQYRWIQLIHFYNTGWRSICFSAVILQVGTRWMFACHMQIPVFGSALTAAALEKNK